MGEGNTIDKRLALVLIVLFALALFVRLPDIDTPAIKQDEYSIFTVGADRVGEFDPTADVWRSGEEDLPAFMTEKPALAYYYYGLWQIAGDAEDYREKMYYSRVGAAVITAFTVIIVFFLGTEIFGRREGIAAAVFYALLPTMVEFGRYAREDTVMFFTIPLAAYVLLKTKDWPDLKRLGLVGVLAGFSFSSKYTGLMAVPILAVLWAWEDRGFLEHRLKLSNYNQWIQRAVDFFAISAVLGAISYIVLVIVYPYLWTAPISNFLHVAESWIGGSGNEASFVVSTMATATANFPVFTVNWLVKTPALILVLAAVGVYYSRKEKHPYLAPLLLWFTIPFSTIVLSNMAPRYSYAATVPLVLLAGYGFIRVVEWKRVKNVFPAYVVPLVIVAIYLMLSLFWAHPYTGATYYNELTGFGPGANHLHASGVDVLPVPGNMGGGTGQGEALLYIYGSAPAGATVQLYVEPEPFLIGIDRSKQYLPPTSQPQAEYVAVNANYANRGMMFPAWWTRMTGEDPPNEDMSLTFREMDDHPQYEEVWSTGGMGIPVAKVYRRTG